MSSAKWRKCVFGCESFRSLFSLPREEPTRQKWEEFIFGSARHSGQQLFVCDRHFREDCLANLGPYRSGLSGRLNLQAGAVPTIRPEEEAGAGSEFFSILNQISLIGQNIQNNNKEEIREFCVLQMTNVQRQTALILLFIDYQKR